VATAQNRSSFQVTVKNRPDLTQSFPFNKFLAAQAYAAKQAASRNSSKTINVGWPHAYFASSMIAPIATGWGDRCRAGFAPAG
jgi:hypothetical protein